MGKLVGVIIAIMLIALVAYAVKSGLLADVFDPFTTPGPGR